MASEQDRLKELLESSLSQVEDYACSIRETTVQNLATDNMAGVEEMKYKVRSKFHIKCVN